MIRVPPKGSLDAHKAEFVNVPDTPQEWRICTECSLSRPIDEFPVEMKSGELGDVCATCVENQHTMRKLRQDSETLQLLIQSEGLKDLRRMTGRTGGPSNPSSEDIVQIFLQHTGGVNGMIRLMMSDYHALPPGHKDRIAIMKTITGLIKENSRDKGNRKQLSAMETKDIRTMLADLISEIGAAEAEKLLVDGKLVTHQAPHEVDDEK